MSARFERWAQMLAMASLGDEVAFWGAVRDACRQTDMGMLHECMNAHELFRQREGEGLNLERARERFLSAWNNKSTAPKGSFAERQAMDSTHQNYLDYNRRQRERDVHLSHELLAAILGDGEESETPSG